MQVGAAGFCLMGPGNKRGRTERVAFSRAQPFLWGRGLSSTPSPISFTVSLFHLVSCLHSRSRGTERPSLPRRAWQYVCVWPSYLYSPPLEFTGPVSFLLLTPLPQRHIPLQRLQSSYTILLAATVFQMRTLRPIGPPASNSLGCKHWAGKVPGGQTSHMSPIPP